MRIEEIIRTCANEQVAEAAVASIGGAFAVQVRGTAAMYGMTAGGFAAMSARRFLTHGDEGEMRSVAAAMRNAQEPLLAGLHRMLCIMLAAGMPRAGERRLAERAPRMTAQLCAMEAVSRREMYG